MGWTRRRTWVAGLATVGLAAVVVAALVFQPWRLVIDTEVDDADPFVTAAAAPTSTPTTSLPTIPTTDPMGDGAPSAPPTTAAPTTAAPTTAVPTTTTATAAVRVGSFQTIAHQTSGMVRVGPTPDGRLVVFLEDLATDNGPDVRVLLSPFPADGDATQFGTDALELGLMKGNVGNQTYEVPAGTDLTQYRSVVLWCERFSVGFGVAGLAPA